MNLRKLLLFGATGLIGTGLIATAIAVPITTSYKNSSNANKPNNGDDDTGNGSNTDKPGNGDNNNGTPDNNILDTKPELIKDIEFLEGTYFFRNDRHNSENNFQLKWEMELLKLIQN